MNWIRVCKEVNPLISYSFTLAIAFCSSVAPCLGCTTTFTVFCALEFGHDTNFTKYYKNTLKISIFHSIFKIAIFGSELDCGMSNWIKLNWWSWTPSAQCIKLNQACRQLNSIESWFPSFTFRCTQQQCPKSLYLAVHSSSQLAWVKCNSQYNLYTSCLCLPDTPKQQRHTNLNGQLNA